MPGCWIHQSLFKSSFLLYSRLHKSFGYCHKCLEGRVHPWHVTSSLHGFSSVHCRKFEFISLAGLKDQTLTLGKNIVGNSQRGGVTDSLREQRCKIQQIQTEIEQTCVPHVDDMDFIVSLSVNLPNKVFLKLSKTWSKHIFRLTFHLQWESSSVCNYVKKTLSKTLFQ